jgi:type II secretory pathway predicted ATPase ExeA
MNPFQPTFGKNPPAVIGRSDIIDDFIDGLAQDVGDERRATLFIGQRGMGKTVMLNQLAKRARRKKWVVADVTDSQTMLQDILDQLIDQMLKSSKHEVTGISLSAVGFGAGVSTQAKKQSATGWRMQVTKLLEELNNKGTGVLFTIDEVHGDSNELRQFATAYQHFVREDRKVAVAMAGLPFEISELLHDRILTFLRRASKVELTNVDIEQVELGMLETIETNGRAISPKALRNVAMQTDGYPYLIQLIGSCIWRVHPQNKTISDEDIQIGILQAYDKLFKNVVEPVLQELSGKDIAFLEAMSVDEEQSKLSDIQARLKASQSYISQYRKRLISADMVYAPKRGYVKYVIPQIGKYFKR